MAKKKKLWWWQILEVSPHMEWPAILNVFRIKILNAADAEMDALVEAIEEARHAKEGQTV